MKKQKKTKRLDIHHILIIFLFGIIVAGSAIYLKYTPKYWCQVNPDKCVELTQERGTTSIHYSNGVGTEVKDIDVLCHNRFGSIIPKDNLMSREMCSTIKGSIVMRKKTPQELLIDDCNSNPREDNLCKCEEYGTTQSDIKQYQKRLDEQIRTQQECLNDTQHNNYCGTILLFEVVGSCIKSRPKFDYEKHPEDYVAETTPKNCLRIEGNKCYISEPTSSQGCWNGSAYLCGGGSSGMFTELKTTYRLKNECEKGNPDWVEEIECTETEEYTTDNRINLTKTEFEDLGCTNSENIINCSIIVRDVSKEYCDVNSRCIKNQTVCKKNTICDNPNLAFCIETNDSAPNVPSEPQMFVVGGIK